MNAAAWLAEIKKLPIDDRIWLVQEIWNGIADEPAAFEPPEWHKRVLDRRLAELEAHPG